MAKVKMGASREAMEKSQQDQGDFVLPKPGYYTALLSTCNDGYSKDADGNEDESRPRLECVYQIVGIGKEDEPTTENYGNIWDYVSFSEESEWKRGEFLLAMGLADGDNDADVDFDTEELEGTKVLIRVKHEKGRTKDDPPRAKVAKLLRFLDEDQEAAFGGSTTEEVEEDTAEEEEGSGDDYLTEEFLAGLETKELGDIAKEFDLDPKALVVRNRAKKVDMAKTKAAVIAAILEAQGAPEGEEAEDDDEPF